MKFKKLKLNELQVKMRLENNQQKLRVFLSMKTEDRSHLRHF